MDETIQGSGTGHHSPPVEGVGEKPQDMYEILESAVAKAAEIRKKIQDLGEKAREGNQNGERFEKFEYAEGKGNVLVFTDINGDTIEYLLYDPAVPEYPGVTVQKNVSHPDKIRKVIKVVGTDPRRRMIRAGMFDQPEVGSPLHNVKELDESQAITALTTILQKLENAVESFPKAARPEEVAEFLALGEEFNQ